MTPAQYKQILLKLDFTHDQAAACCRVHPVTARRWAQNGVTGAAEVVLTLLVASIITADDIEKAAKKASR